MGRELSVVTPLHTRTTRDFVGRMTDDKVRCMDVARQYGREYWDGARRYGYGGYKYDGRWAQVAARLVSIYGLSAGARILDVGCGKAHLLYELSRLIPDAVIAGLDQSEYALDNAKEEARPFLRRARAQDPLPYEDDSFNLVISLTTFHNLQIFELEGALREMQRVGRDKFLVVESYRNTSELFALQCWALTCESFFSRDAWIWLFEHFGYTGDYEFVYFA